MTRMNADKISAINRIAEITLIRCHYDLRLASSPRNPRHPRNPRFRNQIRIIPTIRVSETKPTTQKQTQIQINNPHKEVLSAFLRAISAIRDSETKIRAIRTIRVSKTKPATQSQTQIQTNNPHTGILSAFLRAIRVIRDSETISAQSA